MVGSWEGAGQVEIHHEGETMPLPFTLTWRVDGNGDASGTIDGGGQSMELSGEARGGSLRLAGEQVSQDDDGTVTRIELIIEGRARGDAISGAATYVIPDMRCVVEALAEGIAGAVAPFSDGEEADTAPCPMVELKGEWQGRKTR